MSVSLFLFLFSIFSIILFVSYRYYLNKENVLALEGLVLSGESIEYEDNLRNAKQLIFAAFDDVKIILERQSNFIFHWILHFFVIVLGFVSDIVDRLYALSRDLFLKTATREKEIVAKFWPHLKEYKREKDSMDNSR